ncbi:type II 3-dehydroquinate dehydratase [Aquimarina sp. ERC-38]|uniref:type II 3-dehydroquinate dehydratase n=1 Tax=Aquimarina sp. ERC-38 TaxID=2949996 RepID=UPI0022460DA0|nr:type II 3-dehydroquinate dehydratase [Aquimarina sp. ERC-38]UZO79983.1 type II 3-dehydroquinate dehydratase [Aquimarina sp. ERC-38]
MKILIINGPNLNLLGKREPEVYGSQTFEDFFADLQFRYKDIELAYYQSNHEGDLVTKLQEADDIFQGVVLNAGAYSHTSIAIADAIKAIKTPVIEVHISNTHKRESFRHHSYLSAVVSGIIMGFGIKGYDLAIRSFIEV